MSSFSRPLLSRPLELGADVSYQVTGNTPKNINKQQWRSQDFGKRGTSYGFDKSIVFRSKMLFLELVVIFYNF